MSSFDVKLLKLYFSWISPAPFCTILTPNIKSHKIFHLSLYLISFNIQNCYGLILLNLKNNEKNIKIDKVMPGNIG